MTQPVPAEANDGFAAGAADTTSADVGARQLIQLALFLILSTALVVGLRGVIPQVTSLYPFELPSHPYFVPEQAGLLYLATPLVVIAAICLFLAPGILAVLAAGRTDSLNVLMLKGFGIALLWYIAATSGLKLLRGPLGAGTVVAVTVFASAVAWGILALRVRRGDRVSWPVGLPGGRRRLAWVVAIAVLLTCLLLPVIFWQDLNGDGWEELEIGWSLVDNLLPLYVNEQIVPGSEGRITMAYPISWFALLFGRGEGVVRLPFILNIVVLFFGLLALIEWRSPRRLRVAEEAVLVLGLGVYAVTVCYNASYDPYYADLNVAASETLPVLCMVAAAYFIWAGQFRWFLLFALAAYFGRPTALLFLGLLGLGLAIAARESSARRLVQVGIGIAACILLMLLYQRLLVPWASGGTQTVSTHFDVAYRLAYLRLDDLSRFLFILVPGGILPGLSLLAWRWQDPVARSLTVITVGYFLFFYVVAFVVLHHFIPAMLFPLAVFWRLHLTRAGHRWLVGSAAVAATLALWLSLPRHFEVNRTLRTLARSFDVRIDRQGVLAAGRNPAQEMQDILFTLFSPGHAAVDPAEELVIADGPIVYYSELFGGTADINYVVQLHSQEPPIGFLRVGDTGFASAYVKDIDRWRKDRFRPLRTDYRSPLYAIPRETIFRNLGRRAGNYTIDIAALVCGSKLRRWAGSETCSAAGY